MIEHTERETVRGELRRSNDRFRAAVAAIHSTLWTNSADGRMSGDQPGWSALTGQAYVLAASSDTPEPFATRDTTPDKQTPQLIAAGLISAVLLLALVLWLRRRPKRV